MQTCVVILSGHSLSVEGVASWLWQHPQQFKLEVVDARQPDAMAQVVAARPLAVIVDATDPQIARSCFLSRLPLALPGLIVVCLDPQQVQIQVVTSERLLADQAHDLIEVLERSA